MERLGFDPELRERVSHGAGNSPRAEQGTDHDLTSDCKGRCCTAGDAREAPGGSLSLGTGAPIPRSRGGLLTAHRTGRSPGPGCTSRTRPDTQIRRPNIERSGPRPTSPPPIPPAGKPHCGGLRASSLQLGSQSLWLDEAISVVFADRRSPHVPVTWRGHPPPSQLLHALLDQGRGDHRVACAYPRAARRGHRPLDLTGGAGHRAAGASGPAAAPLVGLAAALSPPSRPSTSTIPGGARQHGGHLFLPARRVPLVQPLLYGGQCAGRPTRRDAAHAYTHYSGFLGGPIAVYMLNFWRPTESASAATSSPPASPPSYTSQAPLRHCPLPRIMTTSRLARPAHIVDSAAAVRGRRRASEADLPAGRPSSS